MSAKPTVYIETTIPSYYHETRTDVRTLAWRAATRVWWNQYRKAYEPVTSAITLGEVRAAPPPKARLMEPMIAEMRMLGDHSRLIEVARAYRENRLLPHDSIADALHLALASVHEVDYLLTWNIRHLANANKTRHLHVLNARLRLATPIITTPDLLVPGETHASEREE